MTDYSELEVPHKEHQVQDLTEWPISKLTAIDHSDRCKGRDNVWVCRMSDPRSLLLLGQIKEGETERHLCPCRVIQSLQFSASAQVSLSGNTFLWPGQTACSSIAWEATKTQNLSLSCRNQQDMSLLCTALFHPCSHMLSKGSSIHATMSIPDCNADKKFSLTYYTSCLSSTTINLWANLNKILNLAQVGVHDDGSQQQFTFWATAC